MVKILNSEQVTVGELVGNIIENWDDTLDSWSPLIGNATKNAGEINMTKPNSPMNYCHFSLRACN